jgi:hypothetical protein
MLVSALFGQKLNIKVEAQELLKSLAYTENSPYVRLYDWHMGDGSVSIVEWDPNGNNWTPKGFERKGKVYLINDGKITHKMVGKDIELGYWNLQMLGNKDKILSVSIFPNVKTMENPKINISKTFIKEQMVCQEDNNKSKTIAYLIRFPNKLPFWMLEQRFISDKGGKSEYLISFENKPQCNIKQKEHSAKAIKNSSDDIHKRIEQFIADFYKAGESDFPTKALRFYDSKIDRYFSMKNIKKEDVLEDKISYYKKWVTRKYELKDMDIIDTYNKDGSFYYVVSAAIGWSVVSAKGKSLNGKSYNLITLISKDNGFAIKAIKTLGDDNKKTKNISKHTKNSTQSKKKTITFSDNGILIDLTYPSSVRAGKEFDIRVKMSNIYKTAKQGGLTLSFPDMISMSGKILESNFSSLKGYSTSDRIYNKNTRSAMGAKYFMIEGWQSKTWRRGTSKYYTIRLKAPSGLDKLIVNIRGILWIRNKYDLRPIPQNSHIYDQQGFAVKQVSIRID